MGRTTDQHEIIQKAAWHGMAAWHSSCSSNLPAAGPSNMYSIAYKPPNNFPALLLPSLPPPNFLATITALPLTPTPNPSTIFHAHLNFWDRFGSFGSCDIRVEHAPAVPATAVSQTYCCCYPPAFCLCGPHRGCPFILIWPRTLLSLHY